MASQIGAYSNFNGLSVNIGEIAIFIYKTSWQKQSLNYEITEVNVSKIFPTGGIDGTNKYILETAIAMIPVSLRNVGIKCSFVNEEEIVECWTYQGGTFTDTYSWKETKDKELSDAVTYSMDFIIPYTVKNNYIIRADDGDFINYSNGLSTDYIEKGNYKYIVVSNLISSSLTCAMVAFYDKEKAFISSIKYSKVNSIIPPTLVELPEDCCYFACSKQSATNTESIRIGRFISYDADIKPIASNIRSKAGIGTVFGGGKFFANGVQTSLEIENQYSAGEILHIGNLKATANTWWVLEGFKNGSWKKVINRIINGTSPLKDEVELPEGIEDYEKISVTTESGLPISGYAYIITNLSIEELENAVEITYEAKETIDKLKKNSFFSDDLLSSSSNLLNPVKVSLLQNGWWTSDYIPIERETIYYCNSNNGVFTYDSEKKDISSISPFTNGAALADNVAFIKVKITTSGHAVSQEDASERANELYFSKTNKYEAYAKSFNPLLVSPEDKDAREKLFLLMPHAGKNLFCIGDSYTMQGQYFDALLGVTGLNKLGDTGTSGNGQSLTKFPDLIINNKKIIEQCKFVTILGGTNDYGHGGAILGTINDCIKDEYIDLKVPQYTQNDDGMLIVDNEINTSYKVLTEENIKTGTKPSSIYASIMTCVNIIHSWDKSIVVVLCSQPERLQYGSQACYPPKLRNGMNMQLIAKAMREIHEMFGVPFYDFHANAWTIDQVEYFMNDGTLHPNSIGGEKLGRGLGMYINSL